MLRKLASIRKIDLITSIEGADKIEVAHIGGWKVVVGKNEFRAGDFVFYFEIDSFLPVLPCFEFLRERCYKRFEKYGVVYAEGFRVKTIKLRGVISQGIILSIDSVLESIPNESVGNRTLIFDEGTDYTDIIGVMHYDEISAPFIQTFTVCEDMKGPFPSLIPKTDEMRIQSLPEYFGMPEMKFKEFEVTLKRDGSSMTVFYSPSINPDCPFGVCSRNMELKRPEEIGKNKYWDIILKSGLEEKITQYCRGFECELAFQGELIGPGIQSNRGFLSDYHWHIFRIWNIKEQCFVPVDCRYEICKVIGLEHVPVLEQHVKVFEKYSNMDAMILAADGNDENGYPREGLVFKEEGTKNPVTFKAVSNKYLLKIG